jgi:hypothetical protein
MFNLITSYYKINNEERQNEINKSLLYNLQNEYINKIYLLNSEIYNLDFVDNIYNSKIIQIVVNNNNKDRLYYDYVIHFINNNILNEKCIISNSDIYFDNTLKYLENYNFNNKVIALTRYDNGKLLNGCDSQDSWIFISPLNIDISLCNFKFGIPGCDNIFAYIIKKCGYDIINPCKTIITHHLHNSLFRTYNYDDIIYGDYHIVHHEELN